MKKKILIAIGLLLAFVGLVGLGCKKKTSSLESGAFQHSADHTYQKIQELRLQLIEAMQKKELKYIHDNMYYFEGLLKALSSQLEGEKKQQVDNVLKELKKIAEAIDNSAGRGNLDATEANLQKLIDTLQELETQFKAGKK